MNSKVNKIYSIVEDEEWNSDEISRLITELESLAEIKQEQEETDEEMTFNSLDRF